EDGRGSFQAFRYPVSKVRGRIEWQTITDLLYPQSSGSRDDWVAVDLRGDAGGKATSLKGRVEGERGRAAVKRALLGNDMPLDEAILSALPSGPEHLARNFAPSGRFDYRVFLRRAHGEKEVSKRFLLFLHDCEVRYKVFPLPLSNVSGTLDVRGNFWE